MKKHVHKPDLTRSSLIYLVCQCGAVKLAKVPHDSWHSCSLCYVAIDQLPGYAEGRRP